MHNTVLPFNILLLRFLRSIPDTPISQLMIVLHRKITWLLLFSIFSLILASWLIYISKTNLEKTSFRINQTHEIIGMIRQISFSVSETDPAHYPNTGAPATIARIRDTQKSLQLDMDSLSRLTRENNDQHPQLDSLRQYLQQPRTTALQSTLSTLLASMMQKEKGLLDT